MGEADQIREDIAELRSLIDAVLDRHGDSTLLHACVDVLRERLEWLEQIETDRTR